MKTTWAIREAIKKRLTELGLSQIEAAIQLGWSHTKLNWMLANYYPVKPEDQTKIANLLQMKADEIFTTQRNT